MHTLWRNGQLLGEIVDPPSRKIHVDSSGIAGLLKPTPAFTGFEPMMQHRVPIFPGQPVFQSVMERTVMSPRRDEASGTGDPRRGVFVKELRSEITNELTPMSEEAARGVPPEKLLEIRGDDGQPLYYDLIVLHCYVVGDDAPLDEVEKHWGPTPASREHWLVSAHRARG